MKNSILVYILSMLSVALNRISAQTKTPISVLELNLNMHEYNL